MSKRKIDFHDEGFAVFNLHVNDAGKRALQVCRARFMKDDPYLRTLEKVYKTGIMAIFKTPPNPVTKLFAASCFIFANGLDK